MHHNWNELDWVRVTVDRFILTGQGCVVNKNCGWGRLLDGKAGVCFWITDLVK